MCAKNLGTSNIKINNGKKILTITIIDLSKKKRRKGC
jgi:hypothetical protein